MTKHISIVDIKDLVDLNKKQPIDSAPIPENEGGGRDMAMVRSMLEYARPRPQSNLTAVEIKPATRRTKISLVIMPKWAIFFAPYGLARITSVTRAAGYATSTHDFNVETYRRLEKILPSEESPYHGHGSSDFLWLDGMYERRVEPYIKSMLEEYLDRILADEPDVVGFTMYYTNDKPTRWMAQQIKERAPNIVLIAGGSQMQWTKHLEDPYPEMDYIVRGEGEEIILDLLEKIESGNRPGHKLLVADKSKRIDLDQLPFPDYSDMDLDSYAIPNAISSELSRGCVAKCVYCPETLFWKYRSRQAMPILEEVEHQYNTYGTNVFWFLDSLVNGNINELRAFALGVVERNLDIKWQGYARCDSRMDYEYLQDLVNGGCTRLDYGIESGSQRVLDAMKKNVQVETIEKNMRDGAKAGIRHFTQWMTCFANERANDIAHSMTLAWRIQTYNLDDMARGTMNVGINEIDEKRDQYGLDHRHLFGQWTSKDFDLTKIHRLIRFKTFNIFISQMPHYSPRDWGRPPGLDQTYSIKYDQPIRPQDLENYLDLSYEDFDYEIIKSPALDWTFSRTLVNEVWPLIRTLWRSRKKTGMEISLTFDPHWDMEHFGPRLAEGLTANYYFKIDDQGHWKSQCCFQFRPDAGNIFHPWSPNPGERTDFNIDLDWQGEGVW